MRRRRGSPPKCHPDRPHLARGLCVRCYDEWRRNKPACHPERQHFRAGRCAECYRTEVMPANELRNRRKRVLAAYGLTADDYDAMLAAQGGACAVCGRTPDESLHVDHDHATGAVRRLLCSGCNQALGMIRDDPEVARRLAEYVEAHRPVPIRALRSA